MAFDRAGAESSPTLHQSSHVEPPTPTPTGARLMRLRAENELTFVPANDDESSPKDVCPLVLQRDRAAPSPVAAPPAPRSRQDRILFLNGLRGLAALLVVLRHSVFIPGEFAEPAVDLFFVLSAFLLTMGFERKTHELLEQHASLKRWGWALLDYAQRRFLRVYPLFALTAIGLSFLSTERKWDLFYVTNPENFDLFKVLTFAPKYRYFVFWSLPLEISYYVFIPPIVFGIVKLGKYWWVPMVPTVYYIVYQGLYRDRHATLKEHMPTFLTGSIAAFVYTRADNWIQKRGFQFQWYHRVVVRTVEMLNLLVLFSVLFRGLLFNWVMPNPVFQTGGNAYISGNAAIVMVCELVLPGAVALVLEWELLRYVGKISFSLYLLHGFVVLYPALKNQPPADKFFSMAIVVGLVGTISYHFVEVPCFKLASRIGKAIKARDAEEKRWAVDETIVEEKNSANAA